MDGNNLINTCGFIFPNVYIDNMWYSAVFTLFCSALWIWAMFRLQSAYKQAISTSNSEEPAASQPPSNIETGPLRAPSIPAV